MLPEYGSVYIQDVFNILTKISTECQIFSSLRQRKLTSFISLFTGIFFFCISIHMSHMYVICAAVSVLTAIAVPFEPDAYDLL